MDVCCFRDPEEVGELAPKDLEGKWMGFSCETSKNHKKRQNLVCWAFKRFVKRMAKPDLQKDGKEMRFCVFSEIQVCPYMSVNFLKFAK